MKQFQPVNPYEIPEPVQKNGDGSLVASPDFTRRLRTALGRLSLFGEDAAAGFQRIVQGENPDGSGQPIGGESGPFWLLGGRPLNQFGFGGTGDGGSAGFSSTTSGVKGKIYFGASLVQMVYDEATSRLGLNTASPAATVHIVSSGSNSLIMRPSGPSTDPTTPWTGQDGGLNLGSYLDEVVADDTDYIRVSLDPANGSIGQVSARIALIPPASTPPSTNTHTLRVHYRRTGTGGVGAPTGPGIDVAIYKNGIVVTGGWISVAEPAPSGSWTTATVTLSAPQIAGLGDYSGLEVWINWTGARTGCSADSEMQVSWVELDPGAPLVASQTNVLRVDSTVGTPELIVDSNGVVYGGTTGTSFLNLLGSVANGGAYGYLMFGPTDGSGVEVHCTAGRIGINKAVASLAASIDLVGESGTAGLLSLREGAGTGLAISASTASASILLVGTNNDYVTNLLGQTTVFNGSSSVAKVPLVVRGKASQTGHLQDWQDSSPSVLSFVASDGSFNGPLASSSSVFVDSGFRIIGSVTPTKKLAFEVDGLSVGTRTLTPQDSDYIVAGTNIVQSFTRAQTIAPTLDEVGLTMAPVAGATSRTVSVSDDATAEVFAIKNDPAGATFDVIVRRFWIESGGIGSGTAAFLSTTALTANRTFSFPDAQGQILVRIGTVTVAPRTTATSGTLISAALNSSGGVWMINGYGSCTVAGTGNVQVNITFTDPTTAASRTYTAATIIMTATTNIYPFSIAVRTTASTTITWATVVVTTGTYALSLRGSLL